MTFASAGAGLQPRTFFVRGFGALLAAFAMLLCVVAASPALAAPAAPAAASNAECDTDGAGLGAGASKTNPTPYEAKTLKGEIRQAKLAFQNSPNHITMEIQVLNRSGKPVCAAYPVFLTFSEVDGEVKDEAAICQDISFNDPAVPRGTYHCTAIIEGPGKWTFYGTVNKPADIAAGTIQSLLFDVSTTIDFSPEEVPPLKGESRGLKYVVEGSAFEVFLLQLHVAMAGLWILLSLILAFLAVPRLRRTLSVLAVHSLEVRRGFLNSSLWATFGLTLGTGLYLLATQTAYTAPFSTKQFSFSAWDKITNLPYAQNYFLVLYAKILIFGVMAVATVVLMLEAGRVAQLAQDAEGLDRDDDDDMWAKGVHFDEEGHVVHDDDLAVAGAAGSVTKTAVKAQRRTTTAVGVSQRTLWIATIAVVAGALLIGGAVTGLKYLHELIETASAAAIIRSGG
ncbi:MAG: hypothetical protein ACT4QF_13330 [Sporichthyaceae bacterium]